MPVADCASDSTVSVLLATLALGTLALGGVLGTLATIIALGWFTEALGATSAGVRHPSSNAKVG